MTDEKRRILCMRIADLPLPHVESSRRTCQRCEAPIWLSIGTSEGMDESDTILCLPCGLAEARASNEEPKVEVMPEQVEELAEAGIEVSESLIDRAERTLRGE